MAKRYLFVGGNPRSGTTALTRLLNFHPEILLGVERFKVLFAEKKMSRDLFNKERFFDKLGVDSSKVPSGEIQKIMNGSESAKARRPAGRDEVRYYVSMNAQFRAYRKLIKEHCLFKDLDDAELVGLGKENS